MIPVGGVRGIADRPPLEWAIATSARWLLWALPVTVGFLLAGPIGIDRQPGVMLIHLTALVTGGLALTQSVRRRIDESWYRTQRPLRERGATSTTVVVEVTGVAALVTLASSATLRYPPSLQFLQLLSALDIAWVTAATTVGVGWLAGRTAGMVAGAG